MHNGEAAQSTTVRRADRSARVGLLSTILLVAVVASGVLMTHSVGYEARPAPPPPEMLPRFEAVPLSVGDWVGKDEAISAAEWDMLNIDAVLSRVYEGPQHSVRLLVEARVGQSRDQFHLPTVCMTAHGWSTLESGVAEIRPQGFSEPIETMWLLMVQAGHYKLVRYWLWTGSRYVSAPSPIMRQLNAVAAWERIRNANPRGALFLCYTDVEGVDDLQDGLEAQREFAEAILPSLDAVLKDALAAGASFSTT